MANLPVVSAEKDKKDLYELLFRLVPVGLGIADLGGKLLYWNDAIMKPGDYTNEDIVALGNVGRLYFDPEDRDKALAAAKEKHGLTDFETRFKKKNGGFYFALMSLRPIVFEGNDGWLAMVEDITSRKESESQLKERNDELEKLNRLLIGREVKMTELKNKIEALEKVIHG